MFMIKLPYSVHNKIVIIIIIIIIIIINIITIQTRSY